MERNGIKATQAKLSGLIKKSEPFVIDKYNKPVFFCIPARPAEKKAEKKDGEEDVDFWDLVNINPDDFLDSPEKVVSFFGVLMGYLGAEQQQAQKQVETIDAFLRQFGVDKIDELEIGKFELSGKQMQTILKKIYQLLKGRQEITNFSKFLVGFLAKKYQAEIETKSEISKIKEEFEKLKSKKAQSHFSLAGVLPDEIFNE